MFIAIFSRYTAKINKYTEEALNRKILIEK